MRQAPGALRNISFLKPPPLNGAVAEHPVAPPRDVYDPYRLRELNQRDRDAPGSVQGHLHISVVGG
ncbi:hypothetical protein BKN44_11205 [Staphylococcus epidermidis]|nr:hypothetical protein BKL75_11630 [Staphylococcus epidermidis]RUN11068.1 hypothetical protein BKN44_11205 [Staphylococcus epidermidis]